MTKLTKLVISIALILCVLAGCGEKDLAGASPGEDSSSKPPLTDEKVGELGDGNSYDDTMKDSVQP